jgi:2-polyprenyl-3-methyl-5-hydroxy-6-metoxy-1,4-benzoquinol methylase
MTHHKGITLHKIGKYKVINCNFCKLIHIYPLPSDKILSKLYTSDYYKTTKPQYIKKNEEEIEYWNITFDEKLETIEQYLQSETKRILDIGCGPGFFLRRAKRKGWQVLGIEPSNLAAAYAKRQGIPVIIDFFQNINLKNLGKFDAIHMFDVLEHTNKPAEILKNCFFILKKGGILIVEVPNDFNILQKTVQKVLGKHEYWLAPPQHINYFTFSSLTKLLQQIGFKIILKESTFPLEIFLLMGHDYIGNDKIGKKKHRERMKLEINLKNGGLNIIKRKIYQYFAELGIGRTAIIYAKK